MPRKPAAPALAPSLDRPTRQEAEDAWRAVSEENRHKAGVRFSIVEEPSRVMA